MFDLVKSSESGGPSPLARALGVTTGRAFRLRGRVVRGVTVVDVVTVTSLDEHAFDVVVTVARDMQRRDELPCLHFHRDAAGTIDGITLAREVA